MQFLGSRDISGALVQLQAHIEFAALARERERLEALVRDAVRAIGPAAASFQTVAAFGEVRMRGDAQRDLDRCRPRINDVLRRLCRVGRTCVR